MMFNMILNEELKFKTIAEPDEKIKDELLDHLRLYNKKIFGEYKKENFIIHAIHKDEVAGGMQFKIYDSGEVSLQIFCVFEKFRYQGIGKKLYDKFEKFILSKNAKKIKLETYEFHNRKFYENRGFKYIAEIEQEFRGKTLYIMKKNLLN